MEKMTPARWQRIRALFDEALERPQAEWDAFLAAACEGDAGLKAEVAALLAAEAAAGSLLSAPVGAHAGGLVDALLAEQSAAEARVDENRMVGPYRLLREIGRGGMGAVYLAERADGQFEQRVALKLIKRGMDSDFVLQRFLRERQILARLQHPHIARLLDGGVSAEGQPYFALEYVEGLPLDVYCDAHRLGVEERLRLFQIVGEAVQYAHRNLIVHRDLKPSNVLVTTEGEVKLLDFGIAKLLEGDDEGYAGPMTQTGIRLMTPAYAAPEQVRGEAVTTATDVYALGVILYELLTGHRPYSFATQSPDEIARTLSERVPERPSTLVRKTAAPQPGGAPPERLWRRLAGDLDTICLMALRPEPERRYASAEALVEDVRRHLAGLPVSARGDTFAYRAGKFVRRHKLALAAAVLVFASLVGGLTAALWQAAVARRERNEKQLEATRANVTRDYVVSLFQALDPEVAQGRRFTAHELIGPGIQRLESLKGQPLERAAVLRVLGQVCVSAGLATTADSLFAEALVIQQALLAPDDPEIALSLEGHATARFLLRDYAAARQMLERAIAIREKEFGPGDPRLLATFNQLAYIHFNENRTDEAESWYRQALALRGRASGPRQVEVARSLRGLADVYVRTGRPAQAMPLFEEAVALNEQVLGAAHSETARTVYSQALALRGTGDYARADSLLRRTLQINEHVYGAEHHSVASTIYEIGLVRQMAGDAPAAIRYYRRAAELYERVLPGAHVFKAYPLQSLGELLLKQGQADEAEEPLRGAYDIYRQTVSPAHRSLLHTRLSLAGCVFRLGRAREADGLLRENHAAMTAHPDTTAERIMTQEQTLKGLLRVSESLGRRAAADSFRAALSGLSAGAVAEEDGLD